MNFHEFIIVVLFNFFIFIHDLESAQEIMYT